VIVVKDPEKRRALRDLYLTGWYEYLAMSSAGLVPWAPVTDRVAEADAASRAPELAEQAAARTAAGAPGMAEALDLAPAVLLVVVDLTALAAVDRDHDRYTFAGGASVYPFAWNLLLAARAEGLGGVITTMAIRREDDIRPLFSIPETSAVAAVVVLGRPVAAARRLRRLPVEEFTWVDRYMGAPFDGSA
jgi:nitroreductase